MKQLLVEENYECGKVFELTGKASRYLAKVRRVEVGDALHLLCKDGIACSALVVSEGDSVCLKMEEPLNEKRGLERVPLVLVFALLKGKKNEEVIRRAVEVGAQKIFVVKAEHSVYEMKEEREKGRLERWQAIAHEAGQQSDNPEQVGVQFCASFNEFFPIFETECDGWGSFICHEKDLDGVSLHQHIKEFTKSEMGKRGLAIFVGPEGGFSDRELELFKNKGYSLIWMGPTVMRAETASITALSVISILLREKDAWRLETKKESIY